MVEKEILSEFKPLCEKYDIRPSPQENEYSEMFRIIKEQFDIKNPEQRAFLNDALDRQNVYLCYDTVNDRTFVTSARFLMEEEQYKEIDALHNVIVTKQCDFIKDCNVNDLANRQILDEIVDNGYPQAQKELASKGYGLTFLENSDFKEVRETVREYKSAHPDWEKREHARQKEAVSRE